MNRLMTRLLPLTGAMLVLAGCAANTEKPAEPVAPQVSSPAVPPAPEPAPAPEAKATAVNMIDHYTVVKGDTLSKIAARSEVFGDMRLWPLLYQDNKDQIKPGGLIFPGQVLVVNRGHSADEVMKLLAKGKSAKSVKNVVQKVPVAPQPTTTAKVQPVGKNYLEAAHRAFEAGDMEWTEYYYSAYLTDHNKDVDAWGELGNVYHSQGDLPYAAECFYNAANLLIDQGKTAEAMKLIPAIQDGDPGLADEIYWRLTAANQ